jgi:hypothetical protein
LFHVRDRLTTAGGTVKRRERRVAARWFTPKDARYHLGVVQQSPSLDGPAAAGGGTNVAGRACVRLDKEAQ